MLKGRMAETLVEELLKKSGNVVYRFGYEAIVQNLAMLTDTFNHHSEVGEKIRATPDFIVVSKKGNPVFVEVKFRWKPELHSNDYEMIKRIEKFWNAIIIFVNCWKQPYFRISKLPYLDKKKNLILKPLISIVDWNINTSVYNEYEELVYRYLTPTLIPTKD